MDSENITNLPVDTSNVEIERSENIEVGSNDATLNTNSTSSVSTGQGSKPPKKQKKLTSPAWQLFKKLPLEPGKKQMAKCKKCGNEYIADSNYGTQNLNRHMKTCSALSKQDVSQMLMASSEGVTVRGSRFD